VGTAAPGKVTKITDFGVFVELEGGVEGLIHISETGLEPQARLEDKFKINDTVSAKIIKTDREERKIALSLLEQQLDAERKQVDEFHATQGAVDQSLGRTAQKTKKRPDAESGDPDVTS
jgi:small subunit ribosomal protein S1